MTNVATLLPPKERRKTRGGLGTYWPQFPGLLPQLQESAKYVSDRFEGMDAEVTDVGFISDAQEAAVAAEQLTEAEPAARMDPAHLAVSSSEPLLRGLGVYHGKRGWRVSVEFDVQPGPVTLLGLGQDRDGSLAFVASEGTVVPGPLLAIGNTTSRVDFARDPGEWVDEWSATGIGHHWSLSVGHRAADYKAAANLLGIDFRQV